MGDTNISDYVANEADRLLSQKTQLDGTINAQKRTMELNESYRKRYAKYIEMMIVLVLTVLAYLAISAFQQLFPFVPALLFNVIFLVVAVLFVVYMLNSMSELARRSVTNYDEIVLPTKSAETEEERNKKLAGSGKLSDLVAANQCMGEECCAPGTTWDSESNSCKPTPTKSAFATIENSGFVSLLTPNAPVTGIVPMEDRTSLSYVNI